MVGGINLVQPNFTAAPRPGNALAATFTFGFPDIQRCVFSHVLQWRYLILLQNESFDQITFRTSTNVLSVFDRSPYQNLGLEESSKEMQLEYNIGYSNAR